MIPRRLVRTFAVKLCKNGFEALADAKDGSSYLIPGFGIVGIPENSLRVLHAMKLKDLTLYANSVGLSDFGHGPLITSGQTKRIYVSFLGFYHILESMYLRGEAEMIPIPQGTLVERMRCARSGIPGFYTPTTAGTWLADGKFPIKYSRAGVPEKYTEPKETRRFGKQECVLEGALGADFTLIKAYVGDRYGNLRFRKISRNFNPDIAGAGRVTVAEVEYLVDRLDPDQVHLPGVFVDRLYQGEWFGKKIERIQLREAEESQPSPPKNHVGLKIAKRIAKEYQPGMYINLGVGMPGDTPRFITPDMDITFQVENGVVGSDGLPKLNEIDPDVVNAGKNAMTVNPGHSYMNSSDAFGVMRGHHLHMTVLGGLEVSEDGDLANYFIPNKMYRGVGGAMDLVSGCDRVVVGMTHMNGKQPKVLRKCRLPLTAPRCISKLVTEYAVFEFRDATPRMQLAEIVPGITVDQLRKITPARFSVSPDLRSYQE